MDITFLKIRDLTLEYYGLSKMKLQRSKIGTKVGEKYPKDKLMLFHKLTQLACQTMRINTRTRTRILQILQNESNNIPSHLYLNNKNNNNNNINNNDNLSVSFHIRRGDKVYVESRMFPTSQYCKRLVNTLKRLNINQSSIKYCFVATDDSDNVVIDKLRTSLQNYNIPCTLYSIISTTATTSDTTTADGESASTTDTTATTDATTAVDGKPEHIIRGRIGFETLLAEMAVMTNTDFFFGTFNSNIGAMVTMYRACNEGFFRLNNNTVDPDDSSTNFDDDSNNNLNRNNNDNKLLWNQHLNRELTEEDYNTKLSHFYRSYGVDNPYWYIP